MEKIGAYEAKTHLPQLLERVARGERFMITRHGAEVAMLVPVDKAKPADMQAVIDEIADFRESHTLGIAISELIREGRK